MDKVLNGEILNGAKTHLQKSIEYTNRLIAEFSDVFNKEDLKRNLQNMKDIWRKLIKLLMRFLKRYLKNNRRNLL